MTGSEGLAQLISAGLFPPEEIAGLLALANDLDMRVARGALTDDEAAALLDAHAERMVAQVQRQRGPFSKSDNDLAKAISLGLNAPRVPS